MYIVVEHQISDPGAFWSAAAAAAPHLPAGVSLHQTLPNAEGTRAVCLWEADSVDTVRNLIEPLAGTLSRNEYFAVDIGKAQGLPGPAR